VMTDVAKGEALSEPIDRSENTQIWAIGASPGRGGEKTLWDHKQAPASEQPSRRWQLKLVLRAATPKRGLGPSLRTRGGKTARAAKSKREDSVKTPDIKVGRGIRTLRRVPRRKAHKPGDLNCDEGFNEKNIKRKR